MENLEIVPFEREGKRIAWLLVGERACMPLGILADMFGIAFFNASEMITRNADEFEGYVIKVEKTSEILDIGLQYGVRYNTIICLTIEGIILWLSNLSTKRSKHIAELKKYLIDWMFSILNGTMGLDFPADMPKIQEKENKSLYLIQDRKTELSKIGISGNIRSRFKSLKATYGEHIKLVAVWDNMAYLEGDLHKMFSRKREHGEWFRLDNKDISSLKKHISNCS